MTHTDYLNQTGIEEICNLLLDGKSLTKIAVELKVRLATLLSWIASDTNRSELVQRARQLSADTYADRAQEVLEEAAGTKVEIARARELAQHFRWKASMADPRRFGTKVELAGKIGLHTMTDKELDAQAAALDAQIKAYELAQAEAASLTDPIERQA